MAGDVLHLERDGEAAPRRVSMLTSSISARALAFHRRRLEAVVVVVVRFIASRISHLACMARGRP